MANISLRYWISFLLDIYIYPEVGLLDHMVVLCLIFRGTSILFSIIAVPIYFLTNSVQGFPFSPSSSIVGIFCHLIIVIVTDVR